MKYVGKITVIVLVVAFLISVAVGLGVIFSIRNVNLNLSTYYKLSLNDDGTVNAEQSDDYVHYKADYDSLKSSLNKFEGTLLSLVNSDDIKQAIADSDYTLVSYEKKAPCTLNITLKKRMDTFDIKIQDSDYYKVYDDDGRYLYTVDNIENANDGIPNIELYAEDGGQLDDEEVAKIAGICAVFRSEFSYLRYVVDSIAYDGDGFEPDYITFNMRTGIKIRIYDFENQLEEKIKKAHDIYTNKSVGSDSGNFITSEKKLHGVIVVVDDEYTGGVAAHYEEYGV